MAFWNSWKDTATRLFVPFGSGADRENSPVWDLGGQMTADPGGEEERKRKELLQRQAAEAGAFARQGQRGYTALGARGTGALDDLQRQARGENSVSAEQLRQGLGQMLGQQRSMAASASPQNAAMAARTASIQSGRIGSGMAGQQALAGLAERNQAQQQYGQLLQGLRGQELQASLGSRQNAMQGYGAGNAGAPEKNWGEKYGPLMQAGAGAIAAFSDRKLKTNVGDGDEAAEHAMGKLKAHTFTYKDPKFGAGARMGVMAQDLERAGLGHAVIDTPAGKAVHGGQLATSLAAMMPNIAKRLAKLEGRGK
jgi:hypothetical protein